MKCDHNKIADLNETKKKFISTVKSATVDNQIKIYLKTMLKSNLAAAKMIGQNVLRVTMVLLRSQKHTIFPLIS